MKRCFGERFNVSVMIDGRVVKGEITVKTGEPPQNCRMSLTPDTLEKYRGSGTIKGSSAGRQIV